MPHKLLIVDDHPIVLEGLKTFLGMQDDIDVVGEATTLEQALEHAQDLSPDLILLDVQLPDGNAIAALPKFKNVAPKAKILILTSFLDDAFVKDALRLGASGYLLKHAGPASLLDHIRAAMRGEIPLDAGAVKALTSQKENPLESLTPREHDVLRLIAQGMSNQDISDALSIAEKTVKTHASSIFSKLEVRDRVQAALLAKDLGL